MQVAIQTTRYYAHLCYSEFIKFNSLCRHKDRIISSVRHLRFLNIQLPLDVTVERVISEDSRIIFSFGLNSKLSILKLLQ